MSKAKRSSQRRKESRETEVEAVIKRVDRFLARRPVSSYFGLQYRLGETGRNRTNPLLLQRFIRESQNPGSLEVLEPSFLELHPGVFSSRNLSLGDARLASERCASALDRLVEYDWLSSFAIIKDTFLAGAKASTILETIDARRRVGDRPFHVFAQILTVEWPGGARAVVCLSYDTEWLFPHDFRLWKALDAGRQLRLPVLVVARIISPPTFVLLKALGAFGLQYYWTIVADSDEGVFRQNAELAGWFHLRGQSSLEGHPARGRFLKGLARLHIAKRSKKVDEAVQVGVSHGLVQSSASLADVASWAADEQHRISMPARWVKTLDLWQQWQGDGLTDGPASRKRDLLRTVQISRIGVRV